MIGVDEVGRGSLAGPLLVVAARQISHLPAELADSKVLSKTAREALINRLEKSCTFGEGWVSPSEVDQHGLASALRLGISCALENIKAETSETIILDGPVNYLPPEFTAGRCIIKADKKIAIVSAASVYAKVRRDAHMEFLSAKFPKYSLADHVGYGTRRHLKAISLYGPILGLHRMSFRPLKDI